MTFKKAEMAKTLKNGLSMIETNPLNHNWLDFMILTGLTLHQFQKVTAVKRTYKNVPSLFFHPIMPCPEASQLATTSVNKIIIVTNDVTLCLKRECSINSS